MISPVTNKCRETYPVEEIINSLTPEMTTFEDWDALEYNEREEVKDMTYEDYEINKNDENIPSLMPLKMVLANFYEFCILY